MLPSIPNGMSQSYAAARGTLTAINNSSVATCGMSLTELERSVSQSENSNTLSMSEFAEQFSDMKIFSVAAGLEEDFTAKSLIGGVCGLMKDITSGALLQEFLDAINAIERAIMDRACDQLAQLIAAATEALSVFDELVAGIAAVAKSIAQLAQDIMNKVSKVMMMIGSVLEHFTMFSDCFEAAAVHNPDVAQAYDLATDLAADLKAGTIPRGQLPFAIREQTRKQNQFATRINEAKEKMPQGASRDKLEEYMARYDEKQQSEDDKLNDGGLGNVGNDTPDATVDPVVDHDYEADTWFARQATWQWQDNNSVAISVDSPMERGVIEHDALSRTSWQGELAFNIASEATHRFAAGMILGTLENGNYLCILKRGTSGLARFEFAPNTLLAPSGYEPETDHSSEQVFQTWAETKGVAMRLVADDTFFTVHAADIDVPDKFDTLQIARAQLKTQNVGFISLGKGIAFHIVSRSDEA
ncbi:hypothetical protein [Pseudoalteromonas umbrosa]|uniref:hypothetical protein n=1 Tax=Pseudoalteromonas umbrosa TaxID=3048489 RepID=UPI0024C47233|nr:hypothetical protein [Pseudoalteromonas sp. B95]MDK1290218.1 hypothetical protein [Pseudoalteromonas sp. B95]